jgi:hypothetical protein
MEIVKKQLILNNCLRLEEKKNDRMLITTSEFHINLNRISLLMPFVFYLPFPSKLRLYILVFFFFFFFFFKN